MIDVYLPLDVPSVVEQTVALALSGGPSPVFLQAVEQVASFKKAFRRQGIGFRRCCQYCPLFPLQT